MHAGEPTIYAEAQGDKAWRMATKYITTTTTGKSKFQGMRERIGLQQITSKA
jgi:hypothetical protein